MASMPLDMLREQVKQDRNIWRVGQICCLITAQFNHIIVRIPVKVQQWRSYISTKFCLMAEAAQDMFKHGAGGAFAIATRYGYNCTLVTLFKPDISR